MRLHSTDRMVPRCTHRRTAVWSALASVLLTGLAACGRTDTDPDDGRGAGGLGESGMAGSAGEAGSRTPGSGGHTAAGRGGDARGGTGVDASSGTGPGDTGIAGGGQAGTAGGMSPGEGGSLSDGGSDAAGGFTFGGEAGLGGGAGGKGPLVEPCILRVKPHGSDAEDGGSWATAKQTIQGAIADPRASAGCQIWLLQGTYAVQGGAAAGDADTPLEIPDGVEVYGGFGGFETHVLDRLGNAESTILTVDDAGAAPARTVVRTRGAVRLETVSIRGGFSSGEGAGIHCESGSLSLADVLVTENRAGVGAGVLVASECGASVVGSRFISNTAEESSTSTEARGAAIANLGGVLFVQNTSFRGNHANGHGRGGAIYTTGDAAIFNSTFESNSAFTSAGAAYAGAIYSEPAATGDRTHVDTCTFSRNSVLAEAADSNAPVEGSQGGAIAGSGLYVENSRFEQNRVVGEGNLFGGAIAATGALTLDDSIVLRNSTAGSNSTERSGGGIYVRDGTLLVRHSQLGGNDATHGSAIRCASGCSAAISAFFGIANTVSHISGSGGALYFDGVALNVVNSVFMHNATTQSGIALYLGSPSGTATVTQTTFLRNYVDLSGAVIHHESGNFSLSNSTMFGATADTVQILTAAPASASVQYSNVFGLGASCLGAPWCDSTSNIGVDPLHALNSYFLSPSSPCVDAGSSALLPTDALDLDRDGIVTELLPVDYEGNPRVSGSSVDIGAYELP